MTDKPSVLVVDDSKMNALILKNALGNDYHVTTLDSGITCLEWLRDHEPDLILLDVMMPDMDGHELITKIKADMRFIDTPVIFVTGKDSDEDEKIGFDIGAVDYITKPIKPAITRARVSTHLQLKNYQDKLKFLAMHDQLTGLYNRHYMLERAESVLAKLRRGATTACVVMLDIDHFKQINDTHGHQAGDDILVAVANCLQGSMREYDVVARFGGEEFVVLMEQCDLNKAYLRMEEIREKLAATKPQGIVVTASFGVHQIQPNESFSTALTMADNKVYEAKNSGRNCVCK